MSTILLADESRTMPCLLRAELVSLGADILEAADGSTALELARAEHPRVAVLDQALPTLDGLKICTQLKADAATRDIPVFVLARGGAHDVRAYAFAAGADYCFAKAWGTRGLRQMIADVLAR